MSHLPNFSPPLKRTLLASALAAALAATLVVGEVSAGASKVYAPKDCTKPRTRPTRLVLFCADFGAFVRVNHWKRWGRPKAKANGELHAKTCRPDCASSPFKQYPVKVRLRKIREKTCGGRRVPLFRKVILHFPGPKPDEAKSLGSTQLFCSP